MSKPDKATAAAEWGPQKVREEDGVHLAGRSELPANHRLRAEALVALGKHEDPDGIITDELIADTKARLKAEAAALAPADIPLAKQTKKQLAATARAETTALPAKATAAVMIAKIEAARAAKAAAEAAEAPAPPASPAPANDTEESDQ